jgi:hypothetical protein
MSDRKEMGCEVLDSISVPQDGIGGGLLLTRLRIFWFRKRREISVCLLSKEGRCSVTSRDTIPDIHPLHDNDDEFQSSFTFVRNLLVS